MQNSIFNGFVIQVLISSVPGVLVLSAIPLLSIPLGFSVETLGVIYLLSRAGSIIGGVLTPWLVNREDRPHVLCAAIEVLSLVVSGLLLLSLLKRFSNLFIVLMLLRGVTTGLLNNIRFSWLRQLEDIKDSKKTFLVTNTLVQCAYGIGGLIIIFQPTPLVAEGLIYADVISSAIGFFIFVKMSVLKTKIAKIQSNLKWYKFSKLGKEQRELLIIDALVAVGMGGTNILLVKYGEYCFKDQGGYGTSLLFYSIFYATGGLLLYSRHSRLQLFTSYLKQSSLFILAFGLGLMQFVDKFLPITFMGYGLVFFIYPIFLLNIQSMWFELSEPDTAVQIFALRTFFVTVLWAVGEWAYSVISVNSELSIRICFVAIAAFLFIRWNAVSTK